MIDFVTRDRDRSAEFETPNRHQSVSQPNLNLFDFQTPTTWYVVPHLHSGRPRFTYVYTHVIVSNANYNAPLDARNFRTEEESSRRDSNYHKRGEYP